MMEFKETRSNSKSVQVDMGELGRALSSFDESIPYLTTVKDELSLKVSAISSESSNIDEVSVHHVIFICFDIISLCSKLKFGRNFLKFSREFKRYFQISMKLQQHKLISREITKVVNSEQSRNLERILHSVNKVRGFIYFKTPKYVVLFISKRQSTWFYLFQNA